MRPSVPLSPEASNAIFNKIALHYDRLNGILSLGLHERWRTCLAAGLPVQARRVLDVAVGTASIPIAILRERPEIDQVVGIDIAEEMLVLGREKIRRAGFDKKIVLQQGKAQALPFLSGSFDAVTIGFALRNVPHVLAVFTEAYRVLKPRGSLMILEFSKPSSPALAWCQTVYLKYLLPFIGGMLSGHPDAYRHLGQSILVFPPTERVVRMLYQAGFTRVTTETMAWGAVTLYRACL